ncbi:ABC transporter ATP-binding protein [Kitasatospora sp. NPDC036755]|uniref:ABC transporter ATP-binding protein n=1 Tax=Kitasatospora sp. NPDC036755 TaxID=3154600 RepID=UPI0033DD6C85
MTSAPVLDVRSLDTVLHTPDGRSLHVLHGVGLTIAAGECLGVVGESGSGKSVLARTVLGVESRTTRAVATGEVRLNGEDLLAATPARRAALLGTGIAMVHQDPMTSLNPVVRIAEQVTESITNRRRLSRRERLRTAAELLAAVDVPDPARRARAHPHELSGGLRQRAAIALAVCCGPELLIADEPTTALDALVRGRILDLFTALRAERGIALLVVTHDLAVARRIGGTVAVMRAGRVVELGPAERLLETPEHAFTAALVAAEPGARR